MKIYPHPLPGNKPTAEQMVSANLLYCEPHYIQPLETQTDERRLRKAQALLNRASNPLPGPNVDSATPPGRFLQVLKNIIATKIIPLQDDAVTERYQAALDVYSQAAHRQFVQPSLSRLIKRSI